MIALTRFIAERSTHRFIQYLVEVQALEFQTFTTGQKLVRLRVNGFPLPFSGSL